MSGCQTLQVEADIQRAGIPSLPAKRLTCRAKGISGIHTKHTLGYHIGHRFVHQHFIRNTVHDAKSQNGHIHNNGGIALFLSCLISLTFQIQDQFTVVAVGILGIDC